MQKLCSKSSCLVGSWHTKRRMRSNAPETRQQVALLPAAHRQQHVRLQSFSVEWPFLCRVRCWSTGCEASKQNQCSLLRRQTGTATSAGQGGQICCPASQQQRGDLQLRQRRRRRRRIRSSWRGTAAASLARFRLAVALPLAAASLLRLVVVLWWCLRVGFHGLRPGVFPTKELVGG